MKQGSVYLLKRFFNEYIKTYKSQILTAVFFMIIYAIANGAQVKLVQLIVDKVFIHHDPLYRKFVPVAIILTFVIIGLSNYASTVIMNKVGYRIVNKMQKRLFSHFINADMQLHYRMNSGELLSRTVNDVGAVRNAVNTVIIGPVKQGLTVVSIGFVMFSQSWKLSLIAMVILIFIIIPVMRVSKRLKKLARQAQKQAAQLTSRLSETLKGIRVVKAYQKENYEITRAGSLFDKSTDNRIKSIVVSNLNGPIMNVLAGFSVAVVIWYASFLIDKGELTTGQAMSFIVSLLAISRPIRSMTGMGGNLQNSIVACERFFESVDKVETLETSNLPDLKITGGEVIFKNIIFKYPSAVDHKTHVLKNINLTVPAGKKAALVGLSGSGKSTIINLLLRFFEPEQGQILIDGQAVAEHSIKSLRQNISLVTQDVFLFDDTINVNIGYGRENVDDEQIIKAAKMAVANEFITKLPNGYDTVIGEEGIMLSGGQKQRISIARALLRDAPILLLDEATSSLDTKAEREFQSALENLMEGKTTLMIAHRLSTVVNADIIYLIDDGEIKASGTHQELLQSSEIYKNLFSV